ADALVVSPDPLLDTRRVQLVTLAAHQRLPAIYSFRENVEIGGLMSYGSSAADRDRQVGLYAGRILKGEAPANLPVMRAAKFEFVFNLRPQGHSASTFRQRCWRRPTRLSSETPRVHRAARRRGRRVAARGARAAGDAGGRIPKWAFAGLRCPSGGRLP